MDGWREGGREGGSMHACMYVCIGIYSYVFVFTCAISCRKHGVNMCLHGDYSYKAQTVTLNIRTKRVPRLYGYIWSHILYCTSITA